MADLSTILGGAGIGGTIGKAIVQLELDTAKYQSEMATAENKTKGFGAAAGAAFTAIGAAAVAGLAFSVNAALEANEAHLKLQNTFDNNAKLADSSVQAFEAQADAIRGLTGVDDEAIISGQALLGSMNLTGQQVQELTPLVVDLAAKYNIDLQAAFKAAGKAADGNTGALGRYVGAIDVGKNKAETFQNVLDALGKSEGFAAERANEEPWLVLKSALEEVAEKVGQGLLPAIRGLSDTLIGLLPLLEKVAQAVQFLPIVQVGEDFKSTGSGVAKFADTLIDTIPILGHYVNLSGTVVEATEDHLGIVTQLSEFYRGKFDDAIDSGASHIKRFADLSKKELTDFLDKAEQGFDDFALTLSETAEKTDITRKEFLDATRVMEQQARQLSRAMREIANENWLPDKYIKFLSDQGPEWLIGFADLTKEQQHKAVDAWKDSTRATDDAKASLDRITGVLKDIDKSNTKHTVEIEYKYTGFDPSKPGMLGAAQKHP